MMYSRSPNGKSCVNIQCAPSGSICSFADGRESGSYAEVRLLFEGITYDPLRMIPSSSIYSADLLAFKLGIKHLSLVIQCVYLYAVNPRIKYIVAHLYLQFCLGVCSKADDTQGGLRSFLSVGNIVGHILLVFVASNATSRAFPLSTRFSMLFP